MLARASRHAVAVVAVVALALLAGGCAWITRASVSTTGGTPNGASQDPSLSGDATMVAFASSASNLDADGDAGTVLDVFVRNLVTQTTERVSDDVDGGDADGSSFEPAISQGGTMVAYTSAASDLVAGDGNGKRDIFVRDLTNDTTTRVSVDQAGGDADGDSSDPSISGDGRYVAFVSTATDLTPGQGPSSGDLYVRDLQTNTTEHLADEGTGPDITPDGRYVAFHSDSSLVLPDTNGNFDVYVYDRDNDTIVRASVGPDAGSPGAASLFPAISDDGRYVAFLSSETNLVPNDNNARDDIFVRDLVDGVTTRASVDMDGGDASHESTSLPDISGDGRSVSFRSRAEDLVPGDTDQSRDYFVRDLVLAKTTRVSATANGEAHKPRDNNFLTERASLSQDGGYVAIATVSRLTPGTDVDQLRDIYVRATREPTVDAVTPASIARGTTETFTLTGTSFTANSYVIAATASAGTTGVTVGAVTFNSDTELEVSITVAPSAPAEQLLITVVAPGPGPGSVPGSAGACGACPTIT